MPTTVPALLLFIAAMLPGYTYVVSRERFGIEKRSQGLRELAPIFAASVYRELAVIILTWPAWSYALDEDRLFREPGKYFQEHPGLLSVWALLLLGLSTGLAFLSTVPIIRSYKLVQHALGPYPHPSTTSAWWVLFEAYPAKRPAPSGIYVGCNLDDGSYVEGMISSFNIAGDDTPDRDLILLAPIRVRGTQGDEPKPYPVSAVCIAARRVVSMFVTYPDAIVPAPRLPPGSTTSEAPEAGAEAAPSP